MKDALRDIEIIFIKGITLVCFAAYIIFAVLIHVREKESSTTRNQLIQGVSGSYRFLSIYFFSVPSFLLLKVIFPYIF